jgi:hypothetical protein
MKLSFLRSSAFLWTLWIILLLGQIVLDIVAYPGIIQATGGYHYAFPTPVLWISIDLSGIGAWCFGWYLDRNVAERTWHFYVVIVICAFWALCH